MIPYYIAPNYITNPSILIKKIKLRPQDINLSLLLTNETMEGYKIVFIVAINSKSALSDPSKIISPSNVDKISLRDAILANIAPLDKKYMILKDFDTVKATFYFDVDRWIKDTMAQVNPVVKFSQFSKTFKFRIPLPPMIMKDAVRLALPKFLIKKFKKYIANNSNSVKWFRHLFPKGIRMTVSEALPERFDYNYDYQTNSITLNLKSFWISALLYALTQFSKIMKERKDQKKFSNPGNFFAVKVKNYMMDYDPGSLKDFLSKRI